MTSWWQKLFGGETAAAAPARAQAPEALRFRLNAAEPLRGSPAGTEAWIARVGNGGQEGRFRFELSPEASQVSEHFRFSGGAFWREPSPASALPVLCAAFGAASPAPATKVSKAPVVIEHMTADGPWFTLHVRLQESKALLEIRFSLSEGAGELRLIDGEKAQAVVDELAQVL